MKPRSVKSVNLQAHRFGPEFDGFRENARRSLRVTALDASALLRRDGQAHVMCGLRVTAGELQRTKTPKVLSVFSPGELSGILLMSFSSSTLHGASKLERLRC